VCGLLLVEEKAPPQIPLGLARKLTHNIRAAQLAPYQLRTRDAQTHWGGREGSGPLSDEGAHVQEGQEVSRAPILASPKRQGALAWSTQRILGPGA
jgi:hypothetical protein